jgi:aspartyl/asparaginyl-tRNA synthetase
MEKYRDEKVNEHMSLIETLLTAISEKSAESLHVQEILKRDPEMSFDKAVQIGMMESANEVIVEVKALATAADRLIVMVGQMADEMSGDGNENCHKYRNRLKVLTNFTRIADEFRPEMSHKFAQR